MFAFVFVGAVAGFNIGDRLFPNSDTWQNALAGLGIAIGFLVWLPVRNFFDRFV